MRRFLLAVLGIAAVAALAATLVLRSPAAQDQLFRLALARALTTAPELYGDDALRVVVCGSSSPLPHPSRAKACVAVFAAGRFWVVDTGPGSWNTAALLGIDGAKIGGVLITHFHSDHIGDLGEWNLQTWIAGRGAPLDVYGGPGVERVVSGFGEAYALDTGYRVAHHGADFLAHDAARMVAHPLAAPGVVLERDGLRISVLAVPHAPVDPAYAYRFDYRGRSVLVSGDTTASPALVEASKGIDVLVHELLAPEMIATIGVEAARTGRSRAAKIMADIPDYHAFPIDVAREANEAGVGLLVFYHLLPPPRASFMERMLVRGVDAVRPDGVRVADDGTFIELPADSREIRVKTLAR